MSEMVYTQLLAPFPIHIKGVGHIMSPSLSKIFSPDTGLEKYNSYINYMLLDKTTLLSKLKNAEVFEGDEYLLFDFVVSDEDLINAYREAFSFFFVESVSFNRKTKTFNIYKNGSQVGVILRTDFDSVKYQIALINHVKAEQPVSKFKNKKGRKFWEKAQKEKQKIKTTVDDDFDLGNLISKMSVQHNSYNLLNIWDLTVYQFYDQFAQQNYIKSHDLSEKIFSQHGGDSYNFNEWLKRIDK